MKSLTINIEKALNFVTQEDVDQLQPDVDKHHKTILEKAGKDKTSQENGVLGWVGLPSDTKEELLTSIEQVASGIQKKADIFVVIGIGGSYLGARAIIEALSHTFAGLRKSQDFPLIIFAGQNISEDYLSDLLDILDYKEYAMAVISKSGSTIEPAIAFRILKNHMEKKYGIKEASSRIIAITDQKKGILNKIALENQYQSYIIPDDIGGRYSVLTPVGLLPVAVAGFNIRKLLEGARHMKQVNENSSSIDANPMSLYAAARNAIYRKGKQIEILVNYQSNLYYITEWWKQLFGESEGKEKKGLFPAGLNFTTDLHSKGQYIQEGRNIIFETILYSEKTRRNLEIPTIENDPDGLNYISGKPLSYVNQKAKLGTLMAHHDAKVPNIQINVPEISEYYIGQLLYFFEMSCAISGHLLGVNPFDQPGVEAYKKNMFALLGKPEIED